MIVPDTNLLIYAHDSGSPFHARSKAWWEELLNGSELVGLCPVVALGFTRLITNPKLFENPLPVPRAISFVRTWLRTPVVRVLDSTGTDLDTALHLLEASGSSGNLTTDAQIAATALRHGAVVHSADSDFARFPGLSWENPLTTRRS